MVYNQIDLDVIQLFKISRRPELRRFRLFHQTGITRRRRNSFACIGSLFHAQLHRYQSSVLLKNYLARTFAHNYCSLSYFRPNVVFWAIFPFTTDKVSVYKEGSSAFFAFPLLTVLKVPIPCFVLVRTCDDLRVQSFSNMKIRLAI